MIDLRGHMPRFTLKTNIFHLTSWKPHKCVLKPTEQGCFSETIDLRGHMPSFTQKMNSFPIYLLWNPIYVCWKPQNRPQFFENIDLRGHMPRFTQKMKVFPSISLKPPLMCVETLRTGLNFPRQSIWGVTCLGFLKKWTFSHLFPWKPHKCVLKPTEHGLFFWDYRFEGSHA